MPGSRFGTAYPPVSAVTTVRVNPVLCDVTVMVAPGSPSPLVSTTRPLMDACCWAKAGTATRHSAATQRTREARHMKGPPKWEAWRVGYWEGYRVRSVFAGNGCCKRAVTLQRERSTWLCCVNITCVSVVTAVMPIDSRPALALVMFALT